MSVKISTPFGQAVPPAPRHAVTVHMPGWSNVERFSADPRSLVSTFYNAYPRMKPHRDIVRLSNAVLDHAQFQNYACLLFSSQGSAQECIEYATSCRRSNSSTGQNPVPPERIHIRKYKATDLFWAVIYPAAYHPVVSGFWSRPGVGISSRFAEANLARVNELREASDLHQDGTRSNFRTVKHEELRRRIIDLLKRAPSSSSSSSSSNTSLCTDDVYLFPTGMASIYKPHTYLSSLYHGTTVLFGMAFMDTVTVLEEYGSRYKFFGLGTDEDLESLQTFLHQEHTQGRKVQAIWAEFPANPILVTPNIARLRVLADQYDIVLAVDDTIGSFANIDILPVADILVTSLTKSFNGYADAIAGSAVLNPASKHYAQLKNMFDANHIPELYSADAEVLEHNSRDYLRRSTKLNENALSLVTYLQGCAEDPESAVAAVHYPSLNPSGQHYQSYMRPETPDFRPGYGCLFSVEFVDIPTTAAFYNNLNVHNSVHLGAPFTLAFAYTMCTYGKRLDWAAEYGLKPTQIRITAGLESIEVLREDFEIAVSAANRAMHTK